MFSTAADSMDRILESKKPSKGDAIEAMSDAPSARAKAKRRRTDQTRPRQRQHLEMLGLMTVGIAHDLNNTLLPITMLAPLLLAETATAGERASLKAIISAAQRARQLVREMSQLRTPHSSLFERLQLDAVVQESLLIIRPSIAATIVIETALDAATEISGSTSQLYQVLLNLIRNAAEAIGDRGGTIRVATAIEQARDAARRFVRLTVMDNGGGIDVDAVERIFDPFFTTKGSARTHGAGIGLTTVAAIVQRHGGSITLQNMPGRGARFDVVFPILQPDDVGE